MSFSTNKNCRVLLVMFVQFEFIVVEM